MVYIEAVLAHNGMQFPFRVDADNMQELMKQSLKIVNDFIADGNSGFNVISFDSNTLNEYNFIKLIDIHLEMQE